MNDIFTIDDNRINIPSYYLVTDTSKKEYKIEYEVDGKVMAYIDIKLDTVCIDNVVFLDAIYINKKYCFRKYETELTEKLNTLLDGILVDAIETVKIGINYCGRFINYKTGVGEVKVVKIKEKTPRKFITLQDSILYEDEGVIYKRQDLYEYNRKTNPMTLIKEMLTEEYILYSKPKFPCNYMIDDKYLYVSKGILDEL